MLFDTEFKDIMYSRIFSISLALIAGLFLAYMMEDLRVLPGFLILLPGFINMEGSINGSLVSRISTALHVGTIKDLGDKKIYDNIISTFMTILLVSVVLGIVAFLFEGFLFQVFETKIIWVAITAGILSNLVIVPFSIISCFWIFNRGHDPDDILTTYVTAVGDIIGILALLFAIVVI